MTKSEEKKFSELLETHNEVEATREWYKWKIETDLYFLGAEVLGLKKAIVKKRGKRNTRVLDEKFHKWLADAVMIDDDKMIQVPRWHLKSSWVKYRIVQLRILESTSRIFVVSVTSNLVRAMLRSIKLLCQNPMLMDLYPEIFIPRDKWVKDTQDKFTMKWPEVEAPQEDQVEVYGIEQTVTGRHCDYIFFDDLIDKDTVRTLERMEKALDNYRYYQGLLGPIGRETVTCTPYHYADLYAWIIEEGIYDKVYRRAAIENGKPIYSFFTLKDLEKLKKRMGPYIYAAQMMCDPSPKEDQLFPPPQQTYKDFPGGEFTFYIAVDPAATVKAYSDETAIVVVAVNAIGQVYVIEALHFKKPGNETARIIMQLNEKYKPEIVGIEFGLQEHLRHIIDMVHSQWEQMKKKKIRLPIEGVKITKESKFDRVNWTLGSFVREGKVYIHETLKDLIIQMERFTKNYQGKDDLVDALSMIFPLIKQFSFRYYYEPKGLISKTWFTIEEMMKKHKKPLKWKDRFAV